MSEWLFLKRQRPRVLEASFYTPPIKARSVSEAEQIAESMYGEDLFRTRTGQLVRKSFKRIKVGGQE